MKIPPIVLRVENFTNLMLGTSNTQLTKEHSPTVKMSELDQIKAEIGETKAKIVETEVKIKKAEDDGDREMVLMHGNTVAALNNNLAELRHKENRLESAGSGNVIIAHSSNHSNYIF